MQAVIAAVLPLKDDAQMKQYLLEPEARRGMVQEAAGTLQRVEGLPQINDLLADRSFMCLHYVLGPDGGLKSCCEDSAAPGQPRSCTRPNQKSEETEHVSKQLI